MQSDHWETVVATVTYDDGLAVCVDNLVLARAKLGGDTPGSGRISGKERGLFVGHGSRIKMPKLEQSMSPSYSHVSRTESLAA